DGVSIVQTADAALEESINIVNTIKQKSIQAAQDGQTTDSRKAIQADISKLRDELDVIAKTTSFNNQKLLSGNFTNKKFQMGAYAGETISVSINSTEANKIGHVTTSDLTFAGEGTTKLNVFSSLQDSTVALEEVELAYSNSRDNGVGAIADAINKLSDTLGISATATVQSTTDSNIAAGTTDSNFAINGVTIGAVNVEANDNNGALAAEINKKTSEHGVMASVDQGVLTLTSSDNRAIEVTQGKNTTAVLGGTEKMSTFGKIEVRQEGTG
ncbi:MAG: flagellar protein FlaB, partial [Planctomycetes bacterium]|nr:flagellar protein FlaB [Planctomycetota bacterium]